METTTGKVLKKVANLFIAAGWLWVFQQLNWITLTTDMPLWQALTLTALVAWLIEVIIDWVYLTFILVTCGIGCITFPFALVLLGWMYLWGTAQVTHWFVVNVDFWWTGLLMSIAFGLVRIHSATNSSNSSSSTSS